MKSVQKGFTLIELLIALSIMSFIGLVTFQMLGTGTQLQARLGEETKYFNSTVRTWLKLQKDLEQIVNRPIIDENGLRQPALMLSENSLIFTRSGWQDPFNVSTYQRVEYQYSEQPFKRLLWEELDRPPESKALIQYFHTISEFKVDLLTKEQKWVKSWPLYDTHGREIRELPLAIKVTLKIQESAPIHRLFIISSFTE